MARKMTAERHDTYVSRRRAEKLRGTERRQARQAKSQARARFA